MYVDLGAERLIVAEKGAVKAAFQSCGCLPERCGSKPVGMHPPRDEKVNSKTRRWSVRASATTFAAGHRLPGCDLTNFKESIPRPRLLNRFLKAICPQIGKTIVFLPGTRNSTSVTPDFLEKATA